MGKEKNINIKINADSKKAESGIDKITNKLNNFGKKVRQNPFTKLAFYLNPLAQSFFLVSRAIKNAAAAISATTTAALKQEKAEILLRTAAENNPYLDAKNVKALKDYASHLQSISTVGDEELLPFMAQLAAAGRTQTEIQDIMSAALDISASGAMSLESAVKNLNKTFSGLSGELGESIPQIKQLTKEQLQNGEAVKVISEQYKGMSKETTDSVGFIEKLKNSFGDLLERVGEIFVPAARIIINSFTKIIEAANKAYDVLTQKNKFSEATGLELEEDITKKTIENLKQRNEAKRKAIEESIKIYEKNIEKAKKKRGSEDYVSEQQNIIKFLREELKKNDDELIAKENELLKIQEEINQKKQKALALKNAEKQDDEVKKAKDAFDKTIADFEKEIKYRRQIGEVISKKQEKQERLNQLISSYINMRKNAAGITDDDEKVVSILKEIKTLTDDLNISISEIPEMPVLDKLSDKEQIEALEGYMQILLSLKDNLEENSEAWNKLEESITGVIGQIELLKNKADGWDAMSSFEKIGYVQKKFSELTSGINSALSLVSETLDNQTSADVQSLENAYKKGLISEEEYYSKKEKIEKDSARKKYKVQMAEWALNLLQTQSAAALAIANSLKDGGTLGMINAAIMGVATAAQLAAQIAAKPVPPSFASGGIVPGTSYSGDNVQANVNSGEMILNARQQRALWETANGSIGAGGGGVVFNIKVNNEAADVASAGVTSNSDGFTVAIKKIVSDAMANGEMNDSFQVMKANIYGRRITN